MGHLAYFSKPKEPISELVDFAEAKDIEDRINAGMMTDVPSTGIKNQF